MIRFRFREDEKRYYTLLSEVYRLLASQLPPDQVSVAVRNLGKLQDLLMLEGVRQGVAAAAISNTSKERDGTSLEHLMAFQLHAHVYGSQDTPLHDVEREWLDKLGVPEALHGSPWLDPKPMRFAPDTEQAFLHELQQQGVRPVRFTRGESPRPFDDLDPEDVDLDAIERLLGEEESGETQEQPQLLDRIRDVLQGMASTGVRPRDWQDLVLRLHLQMHVDAAIIDIQLGTQMGRTVLAQAGFFDLQPGPFGTNLVAIDEAVKTPWKATEAPVDVVDALLASAMKGAVELPLSTAPEEGTDGEG